MVRNGIRLSGLAGRRRWVRCRGTGGRLSLVTRGRRRSYAHHHVFVIADHVAAMRSRPLVFVSGYGRHHILVIARHAAGMSGTFGGCVFLTLPVA